MVLGRRPRRVFRKKRPAMKRKRMARRVARRYNTPVFTETFKAGTNASAGVTSDGQILIPNTGSTPYQLGGKFNVKINDLPQFQLYGQLYQSYRILKAQVLIIPKWNSTDPNVAAYNNATGPGTIPSFEAPRIVYAINDSVNQINAPTSELQVLQDNSAKIRSLTKPFKITFRPKPVLGMVDPTSNALVPTQLKNRGWLGFGEDVEHPADFPIHAGVDWYATCVSTAGSGFLAVADVYMKVSFQCKDPR